MTVGSAQRQRRRAAISRMPLALLALLQALTFYAVVDAQETYKVHVCMSPGHYCCRDTVSNVVSPSGDYYCSNFPIVSTNKGISIGDEIALYEDIEMCVETESVSSCHSGTTFEIPIPIDEPAEELPIPISSPDDCKSPTTPICYSSNGRNCCANTVQTFLSLDASVLYCSSEYQLDVSDIGSVCPCATDTYACLIDSVAVDDAPTISDIVCEEEDFTTLCSLIETCPSIFDDDEMYTLFAPSDEAFVALDEMIPLDTLGEDTVCEILKFHVSEGGSSPIYSDDLVCESGDASLIGMMNDKNTRVKCTKDVPYGIKGGGNAEPANFVAVDLEASNGVIHEIDTVLFFPSAIIKTNIEGADIIPSLRDIP